MKGWSLEINISKSGLEDGCRSFLPGGAAWEPPHRGGRGAGLARVVPRSFCACSVTSPFPSGAHERGTSPTDLSQRLEPAAFKLSPAACSRGEGEPFGLLSACRPQSDWLGRIGKKRAVCQLGVHRYPSRQSLRETAAHRPAGPHEALVTCSRIH